MADNWIDEDGHYSVWRVAIGKGVLPYTHNIGIQMNRKERNKTFMMISS